MPVLRLRVRWRKDRKMEEQGAKSAWHNSQRKLGRWELKGKFPEGVGGGRAGGGTAGAADRPPGSSGGAALGEDLLWGFACLS